MAVKLNPYLNFNGNAKEAIQFYHKVFGGKLDLHTFGEYPNCPEGYEDKIMHGQLDADSLTLMVSEGEPGKTKQFGDNVSMSLSGADADKDTLTKYFNELSEGGEVTVKLEPQMWGDTFGMLKDKFGIYWMVNIAKA